MTDKETTADMVEAVAREIYGEMYIQCCGIAVPNTVDGSWVQMLPEAKAAIAAMQPYIEAEIAKAVEAELEARRP